jgi:heptosyltransferase-1
LGIIRAVARPRILIIRLGAIGDVVRTLPALRQLRAARPESWLAWVVEERSLPVLQGHPDLDEVILLERDRLAEKLREPAGFFDGLAEVLAFGLRLRRGRFDVSLDFQGTFKSGLVALAAGAPLRAGYDRPSVKEGNALFNNRRVPLGPPPVHRVERNLALLASLGLGPRAPAGRLTLPIAEAHRAEADGALARAGAPEAGFVFLYPGSSARQAYKRYPPERLGETARLLLERGCEVVVGPGPGEEAVAAAVRRLAGPRLRVLPVTSLLGMAEIIRRAAVFVGGDTGPMHIAAILGTRVVALFGPTDPALNAPWGEGHRSLDALATGRARAAAGAARPRDPAVFDALAPAEVAEAVLACLQESGDTTVASCGL